MALLNLLSYLGGLAGFLFVTLSLASGLLWIAELIEEHSKHAKSIGMRAIYAVIVFHVVLIFTDSLPVLPTLLSVSAHLVYLSNFSSSWPYISLTSPRFLASCALVVADHFTWFYHFAAKAKEAKRFRQPKYRYGAGAHNDGPAFMDVAAFFAICVWFVPLFLFLSLSANDNALPSFGACAKLKANAWLGCSSWPDASPSQPSSPAPGHIDLSTPTGGQRPSRPASTSLVKSILTPVLSLLPRLRGRRKNDEGLIAPRTPVRGSPLHTPVNMPATSYFPWGEEGGSATKPSVSLLPDSLRVRAKTPPPPRRVQSEAWGSSTNPRGVATRGGEAVGSEDWFGGEARTASPPGDKGATGPRMSLGPKAGESLRAAEVVVSDGPPRRKAD